MRNYLNYEIWQKAHALVLRIYKEIAPRFPADERYGLVSQLKRAAYSIPFNIVEGCSRSTDKEFARFLDIAFGSAQEVEYCFVLAKDLGYLRNDEFCSLFEQINEIKAKIIKLLKLLRKA